MKKTMSRQGSMKQKWVPKGDGEKDGEENDENEYEVNTKAEGPFYDRLAMLRTYELYKSHKGQLQAAGTGGLDADKISMGLRERPSEEDRKPREQLAAQRKAKRLSSGNLGEPADNEGEAPVGAAYSEGAPQGMYPAMNPAMLQYLQSMAYAPQMSQMYGYGNTTIMLRNIPNRYTRDMLIERLNQGYEGQYDFVYLPIDFNSKCNVGYAFINFRQPAVAASFISEFHGAKTAACLPGFSSSKVCEVDYARVQGRDANMDNLRDEKFIEKLSEKPEWQPLFLDEKNKEIPFEKTLGAAGAKKRASRGSASATPTGAMAPGGFMMPPYGPMMYPPYAPMVAPPAPAMTLKDVLPKATSTTMLMLKNVPTTFSRSKLIEVFNKKYKGCYDFLFLPGDSKTEGNSGQCFINFRMLDKATQFKSDFDQKKVAEVFGVEDAQDKVCEIQDSQLDKIERKIAKLQSPGKGGNAAEKANWSPLLFDINATLLPFPLLAVPAGSAASPTAAGKGVAATPSASSKGKGKGKAGNDEDKGPSGPDLPRERVVEEPMLGEVVTWKGKFGWIKPSEEIDHPEASKHGGKLYCHRKDLIGVETLEKGDTVQFNVFKDSSGLGAEEVVPC
mmetsp:Transcript_8439/g.21364  ORF Transcript_8439/g.21364 Transcript_8439/m.21364 type:complete len:616 (-) Transcript_8439:160-2007(-)